MKTGKLVKPALTCSECGNTAQHRAVFANNLMTIQNGNRVEIVSVRHKVSLQCRHCNKITELSGQSN